MGHVHYGRVVRPCSPRAPAPRPALLLLRLRPHPLPLVRWVLLEAHRAHLVGRDFWEEATELLAMIGVAVLLWAFRGPLTRRSPDAG